MESPSDRPQVHQRSDCCTNALDDFVRRDGFLTLYRFLDAARIMLEATSDNRTISLVAVTFCKREPQFGFRGSSFGYDQHTTGGGIQSMDWPGLTESIGGRRDKEAVTEKRGTQETRRGALNRKALRFDNDPHGVVLVEDSKWLLVDLC